MQTKHVELWLAKHKHLQGQHNQKKHGYRGSSAIGKADLATGDSKGGIEILEFANPIGHNVFEKFTPAGEAAIKKMALKFKNYFGFEPNIKVTPSDTAYEKSQVWYTKTHYDYSHPKSCISVSKKADNTFEMVINEKQLTKIASEWENEGWPAEKLSSIGIDPKMKMSKDRLINHMIGAAMGIAMFKQNSDFVTAQWNKFTGGRTVSYAGIGTETNPVLDAWQKMFSGKTGKYELYPGQTYDKNGDSAYWRSVAIRGFGDSVSEFINGGALPPTIRSFIFDNFYKKSSKEFRYKHLQGKHNQKKHGYRGQSAITQNAIKGLSPLAQKIYNGLDKSDQVKFRLAWYREIKKDPSANADKFAKKFNSAPASPKKPAAPKQAPAAAPVAAPAPAAAPAANNALTDPANILYINKKLDANMRSEVDLALKEIASVHQISDNATKIWTRQNMSITNNGEFVSTSHVVKGQTVIDPDGIYISKLCAQNERAGTFCHEFGHYLKDEIPRTFDSPAVKKAMADVEAALNGTRAYKRLSDAVHQKTDVPIKATDGNVYQLSNKVLDYMISRHETFARGYAQYIATKTGNKDVLQGVFNWGRGYNMVAQWSQSDFASVEKAFDNLFSELGWSK